MHSSEVKYSLPVTLNMKQMAAAATSLAIAVVIAVSVGEVNVDFMRLQITEILTVAAWRLQWLNVELPVACCSEYSASAVCNEVEMRQQLLSA